MLPVIFVRGLQSELQPHCGFLVYPPHPPPPPSTTSSHVIMGRGLQLYRLQGQGSPVRWDQAVVGRQAQASSAHQPAINWYVQSLCKPPPPPFFPHTHTSFCYLLGEEILTAFLFLLDRHSAFCFAPSSSAEQGGTECVCVCVCCPCVCEGVEGTVTHRRQAVVSLVAPWPRSPEFKLGGEDVGGSCKRPPPPIPLCEANNEKYRKGGGGGNQLECEVRFLQPNTSHQRLEIL